MNPGSQEAQERGCTCPGDENGEGMIKGMPPSNKVYFLVDEECPMHGKSHWKETKE